MKRFIFAVAAVALVASAGSAQETPPVSAPVTAAPVVIGSAGPVVEAMPATVAPARRGLFGRFRGRGTPTTAMPAPVAPVVTTPGTVVTPGTTVTPATPSAPVPMPMPMPMPGTKNPSTMTVPTASNGIVLASGTMTTGATGDVLMPAMATATATATTTAMPARRGLFGRFRNR